MMTTWKLAPALAAGCTIVLKPDSATPLTALRMAELAGEVGFPPGAINVVPGPGRTVGAHLVRHPGVDKIAFTGSTATGSEIMRLASDPIKRITLELGGKSPSLVFADADLADAIPSSVWSIYYSAGQSCEARSRILVEHSLYDDFVSTFAEAAGGLKVGDPLEAETQVGSLISAEHRDKVHGYVETGREEGAEVVAGGEPPDGKGAFYPPTVLARRQPGDDGRPGGDLRPGGHHHSVRGREGRRTPGERGPVRADGDGLDGRSGTRPPPGAADQGRHGGGQHAVHRVPRSPVRRLQAVRLRPRARARDARALSGDQERPRLHQRQAVQPVRAVTQPQHPYRWVVLAGGTTAQASFSAIGIGLPALAPAIRSHYGLSLSQIGIVLAAEWVGALLTLLPWGLAADRFGERLVLGIGLGGCAAFLAGAAYAPGFSWLVAFLGLAGAAGASVNSASGRAVMQWFGPSQRGLALGIRQTAIPAGGLVAALALPHLGLRSGLLFLAGLCVAGAIAGVLAVREPQEASFRRTRWSGRFATGGCGSSRRGAASTSSPRSR